MPSPLFLCSKQRPKQVTLFRPPSVSFDKLVNDPTLTPRKKYKSFAEIFSARILEGLNSPSTLPFFSPWRPGIGIDSPFNPISKTMYRGINHLMLSLYLMANFSNGCNAPRFMTARQTAQSKWHISPEAKGIWVVHWQWTIKRPLLDENGYIQRDENGNVIKVEYRLSQPCVTYKKVYHASQVVTDEGDPIPPFTPPPCTWDTNKRIQAIQENMGIPILHITGNKASYDNEKDSIHLPYRAYFKDEDAYNAVYIHEAIHSTGHEKRLGRKLGSDQLSIDYAVEELVAEIGAWMLSQKLMIPHNPQNHLAYIQGYAEVIKKDPFLIMRAARDAEKASDYILSNWDDPKYAQNLAQSEIFVDDEDEEDTVALEGMLDAFTGLNACGTMTLLEQSPSELDPGLSVGM